MPPAAVKTYRDLVCYEWAKAIARSSGMNDNFAFIMDRFKKLRAGEFNMSEIVREDRLMMVEGFKACIYCGDSGPLTWDHLVPTAGGGPDTISNNVPACSTCNSSKGARDVIEWYRERSVEIPRVVWGKYLKLAKEKWEAEGRINEPRPASEKDRWKGLKVE